MENYKIRVKIGANEFEAEGPKDLVQQQFETWKELIKSQPQVGTQKKEGPILPTSVTELRTREGYFSPPWDIFNVDDKRKLVTLKVHPIGDNRDADSVLLVLYGYLKANQQDEVLVTKIKESLGVSGLNPARIDRTVSQYIHQGLLLKTGRSKGGKYRLTNTGLDHADTLARQLFEKMAL